jgi:Ca-activated chloride channel family protein
MPGEVALTIQTNKTTFPATGGQQLAYVLVEVMPTGAIGDVKMPLNFCLVLDHSGSMGGAKLDNLKKAARLAVEQMEPHDVVSIVIFDDKVEVIVPAQPVANAADMGRQIDAIPVGGGTTMSQGMKKGLQELESHVEAERVSRMLLLTDGQTSGDETACRKLARNAGKRGIAIAALGLGNSWNEKLLDDVAEASGGVSDFIPEGQPAVILKTFEREVQSAQASVVQNAEMILRLVEGVLPRAVWRVTPLITRLDHRAISDRDVQVGLGSLDGKQGQSVLVEMLVPPRAPGSYRIAQAEVGYDVPAAGVAGAKARADVILGFTDDPARAMQINPYVLNVIEKVTAHKLQTRALREAEAGNVTRATQKLRAAATRLLALGEEELAKAALEEAGRLERGEGLSAGGTKKLRYETRKLTRKQDHRPDI